MGKTLKEVLEENEIELQKSGVRYIAKCPFHGGGDRTPPFTVYPNDTYYCFVCTVWGDAVKFLIEHKGMSPDAALDYVGEDYREPKRKRDAIKIQDKSKVWPLLSEVAEAYHSNLLQTPGAISYLKGRGLSESTINTYRLGYTDGGVLNITNSLQYALLVQHGVLSEKGRERLSHRITIPNIPETGSCDFIMGRTIINDKIRYLGITTPKTIYGLISAWNSPVLFITEGHFDWLVLREWGFPSIVVGGTHLNGANISILRQRKVVIVPDNDAEGIKAALRLKQSLGIDSTILDYNDLGAKDVGELGPRAGAREEFIELVRKQIQWPLSTSNPILIKSFTLFKEPTQLVLT
jgi:DNA primase